MRPGRGWLTAAGAVLVVVGLAGALFGSSDGLPLPRLVILLALLVGIVLLAIAAVAARRARAAAGDDESEKNPPQDRRERSRAFYVRLVVWGLLLVPASLVVAGVGGNTTGVFSVAGPAVVALVVAVLVRLTGRLLVPALIFAVLLFLLSLMSSENEISHPESFADFVPAIVRLVGLAAAVLGASVAIRQRKRGSLRRATGRERLGVRVAAGVLIAASVASFVLTSNARTTIARADGAIVVNTLEDSFDPDDLEVDAGRVRFLVRNEDSYAHTFSVDNLEVDEYIGPRSDRIISFKAEDAGRYDLYCAINGHETMTGSLRVR